MEKFQKILKQYSQELSEVIARAKNAEETLITSIGEFITIKTPNSLREAWQNYKSAPTDETLKNLKYSFDENVLKPTKYNSFSYIQKEQINQIKEEFDAITPPDYIKNLETLKVQIDDFNPQETTYENLINLQSSLKPTRGIAYETLAGAAISNNNSIIEIKLPENSSATTEKQSTTLSPNVNINPQLGDKTTIRTSPEKGNDTGPSEKIEYAPPKLPEETKVKRSDFKKEEIVELFKELFEDSKSPANKRAVELIKKSRGRGRGKGEKNTSDYLSEFIVAVRDSKNIEQAATNLLNNLDSKSAKNLIKKFLDPNEPQKTEIYKQFLNHQDIIDITNGANLRTAHDQFYGGTYTEAINHYRRVNDTEISKRIDFTGREIGLIDDLSKNLSEEDKTDLRKVIKSLSASGDYFGNDGIQSSEIESLMTGLSASSKPYYNLNKLAEKYKEQETGKN